MGQIQSNLGQKDPTLLQINNKNVRFEDYVNPDRPKQTWTGIFCESTSNILELHNHRWRKDVIKQLKSMDLPVWPKKLLKIIKKPENSEFSKLYQTELFWVDTNYKTCDDKPTREQLEVRMKIENYLCETMNTPRDDYLCTQQSLYPENTASLQMIDKAVKELLDSSQIIDDRLFSNSRPHLRHAKTVYLKASEGLEKISRLSLGYLRPMPNKVKVKVAENDFASQPQLLEWKKKRKSASKFVEGYKVNMLSSQVPLVNGMDGRNINDINDLYQAVKNYKTITSLIEKHVSQEAHIFNKLITQFESFFVKKYDLNLSCPTSQDGYDSWSEKATVDLQQFIIILYEALDRFYCLENLSLGRLQGQDTIFSRNNMINFVTSMVFTPKIHQTIFDLYKVQATNIEEKYKKNLKSCKALKPQDFEVSDAYCLNDRTLRLLNKEMDSRDPSLAWGILGPNHENITNISHPVIQEENSSEAETPSRNLSVATLKEDMNQETQEEGYIPYGKAIKTLQNILDKPSPIQKIKVVIKAAEVMNEAVEEFYKKLGDKKEEKLNGDETLAVLMYVVARSQIANLITHCKIIEKFSTSNILSSMSGYYVMTLKACVNYICTMNLPENFTSAQFGASMREFKNSLCYSEKDEEVEQLRSVEN